MAPASAGSNGRNQQHWPGSPSRDVLQPQQRKANATQKHALQQMSEAEQHYKLPAARRWAAGVQVPARLAPHGWLAHSNPDVSHVASPCYAANHPVF